VLCKYHQDLFQNVEKKYIYIYRIGTCKQGKGEAIPLLAWTDPEGSRRLRLPDFKIIGI